MPVPLFFQVLGVGPPLIILHGLLGSSVNWRTIAGSLSAQHRVFLLDQRNHGQSPHSDTMSYPELATDLYAFMDEQRLPQATLLGHSMGGKVAMLAALQHPERVAGLIAVDIAPKRYRRDYAQFLQAMRRVDLLRVARRADAEIQLAETIADIRVRRFLLQNLVSGRDGYRWRISLTGIEEGLPNMLGFPELGPSRRYWEKTMFIRGEQSDYIVPDDYPAIHARFPLAKIVTIAGATHWVHVDQPQRFVAAVQRFFQQ